MIIGMNISVIKIKSYKLIDLAKEIPQTQEYIYDAIHLNATGSKLVSDVIVKELTNYCKT